MEEAEEIANASAFLFFCARDLQSIFLITSVQKQVNNEIRLMKLSYSDYSC